MKLIQKVSASTLVQEDTQVSSQPKRGRGRPRKDGSPPQPRNLEQRLSISNRPKSTIKTYAYSNGGPLFGRQCANCKFVGTVDNKDVWLHPLTSLNLEHQLVLRNESHTIAISTDAASKLPPTDPFAKGYALAKTAGIIS